MKHTFLFKEGTWLAEGKYSDENNKVFPVKGEIKISHNNYKWINTGKMFLKIKKNEEVEIENSYEIDPFKDDKDFTHWVAKNPEIGQLMGRYVIVNNTIISSFVSENGDFSGVDNIIMVDKNTYNNTGYLSNNGKKSSSWWIKLKYKK